MELRIPPPIQTLFWGFLMWVLDDLITIELGFPETLKLIACFLLIAAASVFLVSALIGFVKQKTTVTPLNPQKSSSIVKTGVYAYSRNPMYLGMGLLLFAWFIWLENPINIILMFAFTGYMTRFQIIPEERILEEKFGEPYTSYCEQVRRWI